MTLFVVYQAVARHGNHGKSWWDHKRDERGALAVAGWGRRDVHKRTGRMVNKIMARQQGGSLLMHAGKLSYTKGRH